MTKVLDNTGLGYLITKIKAAFWPKSDVVTITLADVATTGNYNDLTNKPTIPTVPTIDTSIDNASSNTDTAGAKAVYDAVHPATGSSQPAGGMLPNVLYKLGTLTGTVTISFAAASDANIENEYKFTFTAGSTAPTITWPASITKWAGNCVENGAPVIASSNYYEVSVEDGVAFIVEVEA